MEIAGNNLSAGIKFAESGRCSAFARRGWGVGSYWVAMAFLAALILHLYTCRRFDRPMRALSRAMRQVTEGDFTVRVKPFHHENKFDYMDIMFANHSATA